MLIFSREIIYVMGLDVHIKNSFYKYEIGNNAIIIIGEAGEVVC